MTRSLRKSAKRRSRRKTRKRSISRVYSGGAWWCSHFLSRLAVVRSKLKYSKIGFGTRLKSYFQNLLFSIATVSCDGRVFHTPEDRAAIDNQLRQLETALQHLDPKKWYEASLHLTTIAHGVTKPTRTRLRNEMSTLTTNADKQGFLDLTVRSIKGIKAFEADAEGFPRLSRGHRSISRAASRSGYSNHPGPSASVYESAESGPSSEPLEAPPTDYSMPALRRFLAGPAA